MVHIIHAYTHTHTLYIHTREPCMNIREYTEMYVYMVHIIHAYTHIHTHTHTYDTYAHEPAVALYHLLKNQSPHTYTHITHTYTHTTHITHTHTHNTHYTYTHEPAVALYHLLNNRSAPKLWG